MQKVSQGLSFRHLDNFLDTWDFFVITSHSEPDGDATGSEYALALALEAKGKKALVLNPDVPEKRFTFYQEKTVFHTLDENYSLPQEDFALFIVDTSDFDHLGRSNRELVPRAKDIFIIDHHNTTATLDPQKSYIDPNAAATTEILFRLYKHWKLAVSEDVAWGMFTGLVFDTGSFVYPKTSSHSFEMARVLLEIGVKPKEVHSQLYERMTPQRLRLLAEVQAGFVILADDRLAIQTVTQEMLRKTGAELADSDNLINYPLKSSTVKISVFFREASDGSTKVSLRSKGNLNVASFAEIWGGGGHTNAAGFTIPEALDQVKAKVVESLIVFLNE